MEDPHVSARIVRNLMSYSDAHDGTLYCADISGGWVYWIRGSFSEGPALRESATSRQILERPAIFRKALPSAKRLQ